ncbi:MAG TPA: ABC transporter permease [Pseudonocardiaceae bacterium]|nr:ABC transporter permease [Pseudonocardiaceae bacterium]
MTTTTTRRTPTPEDTSPSRDTSRTASALVSLRTFGSVLWRDVFVTGRELVPFLAQVVIQPFFMLFIFGKVLTNLGYVNGAAFAPILMAGIVALNGFLGGLQNTTMPLIMDFSFTREIEDRLLAPMPVPLVAVEKMIFGAMRGIVAAVLMVPVGLLILNGVSWPLSKLPAVFGVIVLGSLAGAAIGMVMGTLVTPRRINIMFAVILTPLMFTGCTQFPWRGLAHLRWFQVVCAFNPLTYISEAMRAILVPGLPSLPLLLDIGATVLAIVIFGGIGIWGFMRRAID